MRQNIQQQEELININEIITRYLSIWKWIILSIIVCLTLASFYLLNTNNKYQITSSILIKEEEGGMTEFAILDELGLPSGKNNVDNEMELLKSADLLRNTVYATNYHISYAQKNGLKKETLFNLSPITVKTRGINLDTLQENIEIIINKDQDYKIETSYLNNNWVYYIKELPVELSLPIGNLELRQNSSIKYNDENLLITISNPEEIAVDLSKTIKIIPTSKKSSVINISINNENVFKGKMFLQKLVDIYNLQAIEDKNMIAYNTSVFVTERLKSLSLELKDVEQTVESFKSKNKITDISSQAELFIEQTGLYEERNNELVTQLNIIEYIDDFIKNKNNKHKLIPNLGITDLGLAVLINKYNELILEKERIEKTSTTENPTIYNIISQLENMHSGIKNSVSNVKNTLLIAKKDLNKDGSLTANRIQEIPRIEREFIEIKRQQQIKETLYIFLLQKKEETNLTLAATTPKAKMVSHPRAETKPVSPKRSLILLIALILGLSIPIIIKYLIDLFQTKIKSKEDLEKICNTPILGEIPKHKSGKHIAVGINDTSSVTELFRSLRNNLTFILSDPAKKVISITSTVSGEGKTFVICNLALTFAMIEKKVLLVGLDIRNPSLATYIGIEKKNGLTSYLSTGEKREDLIEKSNLNPYLDIIQAGIIPPNPNELLNKIYLDELFVELRKKYDYILIDTAPVGIISDTFLINRITDLTLYVTREGITSKNSISYINELYKEKKLTNINVILNDTDIEKKRYGYGYGYKYYQGKSQKKNGLAVIKGLFSNKNN